MLLEFDVVGRDEVDSAARIPVLVAHERRGTVLMGWIQFKELFIDNLCTFTHTGLG